MYVYSADTYCDSCGESICASLTRDGLAPEDPSDPYSFDSGDYPKYGAEESTDWTGPLRGRRRLSGGYRPRRLWTGSRCAVVRRRE